MKSIEELNQRLSEIEREKRGISLEDALKKEMAEYKGDDEVVSFEEYKKTHADLIKKGFSSGIVLLDGIIDGFHEGDLITITSSTGMGKTSWCQFLTCSFSKIGIKSLWFSYEVPTINFLAKFGDDLPDGYLPKILIDRKMVWIERKIVEGIVKFGIKVVFIDHLHYLFNLGESRNVSLEIGEIMRSLKIIAKKYNITIFIISHTKKVDDMGIIGLDSLRDSSFTGQESDYVIALWRIKEKQTRKDIEEFGLQYRNETIISVIKNRYNGQLKSFKLYYKDNCYYESMEDSLT